MTELAPLSAGNKHHNQTITLNMPPIVWSDYPSLKLHEIDSLGWCFESDRSNASLHGADSGADMAPGTDHQYCLAAINPIGYSHDGYISSQTLPSSCASFKIKWESILTGRVTLGPTVGSLPVEGLSLSLSLTHTHAPSPVLLTGRVTLGPIGGSLPVEGLSDSVPPRPTSFLCTPSNVSVIRAGFLV